MTTQTIAVIILMGSFLLLLLMRMEIIFSVMISSMLTMFFLKLPVTLVATKTLSTLRSYGLLAIPLFIIAGEILADGSLSEKIVQFVEELIGWMRGGLAMVNIIASTFFGGISGSPLADVSSLGTVLIPMMKKQGYDENFATAVTLTSAQQGLMIPPSHNMVIYAMAAGGAASVSKLFLAGIAPGLLLALVLMGFSYIKAIKHNYPKGRPFSLKRLGKTFFSSFWGLMTLVIIVIGCTTGIFTATEAAAISILWALFVTTFIYRDMTKERFWRLLKRCVHTVGIIMIAMGISATFGFLIAFLKVPQLLSNAIMSITTSYIGIIMIFNLAIGMMTPPVGACLQVGSVISGIKIEKLAVTLLPWLGIMLLTLLLVTFCPAITMALPNFFAR